MVVRLSQISDFQIFYNKIKDNIVDIKTAYKISKINNTLKMESDFHTQKISEIVDKYCKRDERGNKVLTKDGTGIQLQEDKIEICSKEIADLDSFEVEIDIPKISLNEIQTLNLTIGEISSILPFIEE